MVLTRLGNKKKLANKLFHYFPQHTMRITLFFGAGGEFFELPRAKYNVINDLDQDVCNLFLMVTQKEDELIDAIRYVPISDSLLKHWKINIPEDPIEKAVRFLLISNFTYLGKGDTIRYGLGNEKANLINSIKKCRLLLGDSRIMNEDFRDVLDKISFSPTVLPKEKAFAYLDPVYLDTDHFYKVPTWTAKDTFDCFELMENSGIRCAMSEFDHPFVIDQAKKRGMNVIPIQRRRNIKNRRTEILITNYSINQMFG